MRITASLACAAVVSAIAVGSADQGASRSVPAGDLVDVYATVRLKDGTIATDLTREEFQVFEDGKPREIAEFSRTPQPLSVALLFDTGINSADEDVMASIRNAAAGFMARLLPGDRASVGTLTYGCQPLTNDARQLTATLGEPFPYDYGSPLFFATGRAVDTLVASGGRPVVLLVSSGHDNNVPNDQFVDALQSGRTRACTFERRTSIVRLTDVMQRVQAAGASVYAIALPAARESAEDTQNLAFLAGESGGSFQVIGEASKVDSLFTGIIDELHAQYRLAFAPAKPDGKRHKIEVKTTRRDAKVAARKGHRFGTLP
jgi:VWFA-related protein